jgi:hypothetical protein
MKVSKVPKGTTKQFARGGSTKMFGAADRTKSKYPADPQKPGQTSGQARSGKPAKRQPARTGQSKPRPAA